ncbi:PTS fructose transporter subunit IIABC [Mammaliicoccus sp. Dog046]|nr:PTS fructose transporter subunit IIABC [Mammaliicoccus sp. Dog046]WQK86025.1 PTS fructose transporter subunit IIABC [Mammaliicoccus sp. Dog046]
MKLLAITSCPNGIAHTYMAAENLQKAADKMGVQMKVETQGGVGVENELTSQEIREADGIIIAADRKVDKSRFNGKKLIDVSVGEGIRNPEGLIKRMQDDDVSVYTGGYSNEYKEEKRAQNPIYQHLMNGVSFMVPFIVVGGLLVAIALSLGGKTTPEGITVPEGTFWYQIQQIGSAAFTFMIPILAGYIAYSIADKPGLVPGMIGGLIAATGSYYGSEAGAGFIGGIIAGFLAGYIALWIKKIKVPKAMQPVMPIIFIPVISSVLVGLIFIYVIGAPIASIFEALSAWLKGMQGSNAVVLALILGAMISFDMGGPVNKVAFLFGSAMIGEGNYTIMGAIAAAICIPPIGLGLATFIRKNKFNDQEIEMGKASFTMGLFGITEGAIPFAAQDPIRVIPSIMVGSMTGAVVAMLTHVGDRVAHGGPIVAVLGAVDNVIWFFVAVLIGALVTAALTIVLKRTNTVTPEGLVVEDTENQEQDKQEDKKLVSKKLITITNNQLTQEEVIDQLISHLEQEGIVTNPTDFKSAIMERESQSSTGIGMNVAIPHAKSTAVTEPKLAIMKANEGVDWNSLDGTPSKLIFMIAVPANEAGDTHLKILQSLSRKLMDDDYRNALLNAETKEKMYTLLRRL